MENASKALIIAAGTLIGIMILSIIVYLVTTFGNYSSQVYKEIEGNQLAQFNSQFTKYDGRDNITIHDIISVANLAADNNEYYNLDDTSKDNENTFYIYVYATSTASTGYISDFSEFQNDNEKMNKELLLPNYELQTYKCKVYISSTTKRVYKVVFTKN